MTYLGSFNALCCFFTLVFIQALPPDWILPSPRPQETFPISPLRIFSIGNYNKLLGITQTFVLLLHLHGPSTKNTSNDWGKWHHESRSCLLCLLSDGSTFEVRHPSSKLSTWLLRLCWSSSHLLSWLLLRPLNWGAFLKAQSYFLKTQSYWFFSVVNQYYRWTTKNNLQVRIPNPLGDDW